MNDDLEAQMRVAIAPLSLDGAAKAATAVARAAVEAARQEGISLAHAVLDDGIGPTALCQKARDVLASLRDDPNSVALRPCRDGFHDLPPDYFSNSNCPTCGNGFVRGRSASLRDDPPKPDPQLQELFQRSQRIIRDGEPIREDFDPPTESETA